MSSPVPVPAAHHEPVASVLRTLQLRKSPAAGNTVFRGDSLPQARRVYGGQVVAQGLLAAAATIPDEPRQPHSLHAYFLRGGDPDQPIDFSVDLLRDGRSFSARSVNASQAGRTMLTMASSFQRPEEGPASQAIMPSVPEPEATPSALALFQAVDHPVAKFLGKTAAFDARHVQSPLYVAAPAERSSTQEVWMRPRSPIPEGTPQVVHRALLAYVIDQIMMEPSLRSVGLHWSLPGLSLASLDHAMWFHGDVDVNEWHLFAGTSISVSSGRARANAEVFTRDGALVASATQEAMVRVPPETGKSGREGRWTFG